MGRDVFFYNDGTGRVEKLHQQLDPGNYQLSEKCFYFFFFYYLLGLRATLHLWFLWKKNIQKIDDYDKKSGIHNTIIRVSTYYQNNQLIRLKKIGVRQGIGIR
jgi:hypothetical protein